MMKQMEFDELIAEDSKTNQSESGNQAPSPFSSTLSSQCEDSDNKMNDGLGRML